MSKADAQTITRMSFAIGQSVAVGGIIAVKEAASLPSVIGRRLHLPIG